MLSHSSLEYLQILERVKWQKDGSFLRHAWMVARIDDTKNLIKKYVSKSCRYNIGENHNSNII